MSCQYDLTNSLLKFNTLLIFSTAFAMIYSTKNTIAKGVKINDIDLSGLKRGQFKYLKPKQIADLKNYIKKIEKLNLDK